MNDPIANSGAWGLALIFAVVASWLLYRYLAPKTWKEWAGAGVVQAFIIALYAEMYGFPLTIYLLVRFFGLDQTNLNVNLWSTLIDLGETGMMIAMILGYVLLFAGFGIFMEGWRELYRARKENRLVTDGLYGLVRHPQYTGLFIALFGEGVVHWPTIFSVALFPIIVLIYYLLARSEERKVLEQFGDTYRAYRTQVPMFLPRWGQWRNLATMRNKTPDGHSLNNKNSFYDGSRNKKEGNIMLETKNSEAIDPICGMTVDQASAIHAERDGKTFYFCSENCREKFLSTPTSGKADDKSAGCCG